ncbi:MAG TPA: (d)CMP kinase, partial [Firmicutes bacterium]|nr:(d)CMP kinase [Bacillota bacterium]
GMVSHAAALPEVRGGMCALQRQMANSSNVVMEGRDIGTVVLPMATYKFFLTASAEVRAMRRYQELMAKGIEIDFATVLKEITERDRLDSSRKYAPLCKADDAIELDTSGLDADEVLSLVLSIIK